jgi:prophage antirepressor-like protein
VAKDVCEVLGHSNPTSALQVLDDDERSKKSLGRQGETNIISESGLYTLILRSNKPKAKQFRKWVTSEVIPTIRKTGSYTPTLSPSQQREIQKMVADKVQIEYKPKQKPVGFKTVYRSIKDRFEVPSYKDVPRHLYDDLVKFLNGDPKEIPEFDTEMEEKINAKSKGWFDRHWKHIFIKYDKEYTVLQELHAELKNLKALEVDENNVYHKPEHEYLLEEMGAMLEYIRTHLKKVFWPKLGVGRSVQVLEIHQYSSGLNLAAALILNQNPFFEIGSRTRTSGFQSKSKSKSGL